MGADGLRAKGAVVNKEGQHLAPHIGEASRFRRDWTGSLVHFRSGSTGKAAGCAPSPLVLFGAKPKVGPEQMWGLTDDGQLGSHGRLP